MDLEMYCVCLKECIKKVMSEEGIYDEQNKLRVGEQTIAFRLAYYLQTELIETKGIVVDLEYYKNQSVTKKVYGHCKDKCSANCLFSNIDARKPLKYLATESTTLLEYAEKAFERSHHTKFMRPDILIHSRGNNDNNVLAIEIKTNKVKLRDRMKDYSKLANLTCNESDYKYQLGVFLNFIDSKKCKFTLIRNGNIIDEDVVPQG